MALGQPSVEWLLLALKRPSALPPESPLTELLLKHVYVMQDRRP